MRAFERAIAVDKPEKTLTEMFRDFENIGNLYNLLTVNKYMCIVFVQLLKRITRDLCLKTEKSL